MFKDEYIYIYIEGMMIYKVHRSDMEMSQNSDQASKCLESTFYQKIVLLEWRQHWIEVMMRRDGTWATFYKSER